MNYAGKLYTNYTPSAFEVSDVFTTGLAMVIQSMDDNDEEYRMTMKLENDYQTAQRLFLEEYKSLPAGFSFKESLINQSPQLQSIAPYGQEASTVN